MAKKDLLLSWTLHLRDFVITTIFKNKPITNLDQRGWLFICCRCGADFRGKGYVSAIMWLLLMSREHYNELFSNIF